MLSALFIAARRGDLECMFKLKCRAYEFPFARSFGNTLLDKTKSAATEVAALKMQTPIVAKLTLREMGVTTIT